MAGRPKKGIDYSGWDVDIFENDTKIDELLDAQGWTGFSIYFYLCQRAYASEGYFYRWSYANSATTARRMGGGIGSETVKQTVAVCLQIGLFNKRLFDLGGVLTSKGIQRRFAQAIQTRRCKTANRDIWLLDDKETRSYGIVLENSDLLPTNSHLQDANAHLQDTNAPKSKVKESKVKESNKTLAAAKPQRGSVYQLIDERAFSPELENTLKSWVSYKAEKRQGYKATGSKSLLDKAEKAAAEHGDEAVIEAIVYSMANGYQGIVWDNLGKDNRRPKAPAAGNRFNNFPQRDNDYDNIEKQLLGARKESG